ncbi:MAG: hypothetical protein AAGI15_15905, partial [Pseudomonadota bacterium]
SAAGGATVPGDEPESAAGPIVVDGAQDAQAAPPALPEATQLPGWFAGIALALPLLLIAGLFLVLRRSPVRTLEGLRALPQG